MNDSGGFPGSSVPFTGERMVPESAPASTFWEHLYRYIFASRFVDGKFVLDIASGEGYGACGLSRCGARFVIGIDVSHEACKLASSRYDLPVLCANAECLPLASNSVDLITSFETIEHLSSPGRFLADCARVLRPDGVLIISTPNRSVYGELSKDSNPYHTSELDESEFCALLREHFEIKSLYSQAPVRLSRWCLHTLCLEDSPWLRYWGVWRLREMLRSKVHCNVWEPPPHAMRRDAASWVVPGQDWASRLVNRYEVRRYPGCDMEEATFLLGVATPLKRD